jgi:hypothetical protein
LKLKNCSVFRGRAETERAREQKPEGSLPSHRKEVKLSEVTTITGSFPGNSCYHSIQNFCLHVVSKHRDSNVQTITLPFVLYGYETWSLTLREENWLRVFENRVLREIFGTKRDKVTMGWRKLCN